MAEEHLESGWDEATRVDDTLVRAATLALASEAVHLASAMGGVSVTTATLAMSDAGSPSMFLNVATALRPDFDVADVDGFFGARPGGGYLLFSPFPTADLRAAGWELVGHPPLMYRPPGEAMGGPPGDGSGRVPADLLISEVGDAAGLAEVEAVLVDGFPLTDLQPPRPGCLLGAPTLASDGFHAFVGRVDGQAVAASTAHCGPGPVLVSWVATLPDHRGRGYGAALTRRAVSADPTRGAVLLASDDGRPVYERMGFLAVLRFTAWQRPTRPPQA